MVLVFDATELLTKCLEKGELLGLKKIILTLSFNYFDDQFRYRRTPKILNQNTNRLSIKHFQHLY